jgi:hypothetical protein
MHKFLTQPETTRAAVMCDFFMGEPPAFSDILKSLQQIEQQTNSVNC